MTKAQRVRRFVQLAMLLCTLAALTRPTLASGAGANAACALCVGYSLCASWEEGTTACYVDDGVCDQWGSSCS